MGQRLQRDWEAVYREAHDEWDVVATVEGGDPADGSDRYSIFDSLEGEAEHRMIAAAPAMLEACEEAFREIKLRDGSMATIALLRAAIVKATGRNV